MPQGVAGSCVGVISAVSLLAVLPSQADPLGLVNASFELYPITPPENSTDYADYVLPVVFGWVESGPVTSQQGFTGTLDTGVFLNAPIDFGGGFILPPISNADGNQLAFMQVNSLADGISEPHVSILQESSGVFEIEKAYTFTLGIGPGVLFPPSTDDEINNPATIVLSLGYIDPGTSDFINLGNRVVNANELNGDATLKDFFVTVGPGSIGGPALGNEVTVRVLQLGGTGGGFNLDNARLESVPQVPEPASMAVLGLGAAGLLRRRR